MKMQVNLVNKDDALNRFELVCVIEIQAICISNNRCEKFEESKLACREGVKRRAEYRTIAYSLQGESRCACVAIIKIKVDFLIDDS